MIFGVSFFDALRDALRDADHVIIYASLQVMYVVHFLAVMESRGFMPPGLYTVCPSKYHLCHIISGPSACKIAPF